MRIHQRNLCSVDSRSRQCIKCASESFYLLNTLLEPCPAGTFSYSGLMRVAKRHLHCREYFELFTFEHCNSGDELLISYGGDKCNFELMRDYGFVLEGSTTSSDRIHFVYECQCLLRNQGADLLSPSCFYEFHHNWRLYCVLPLNTVVLVT